VRIALTKKVKITIVVRIPIDLGMKLFSGTSLSFSGE
jgi:hypothetical protein